MVSLSQAYEPALIKGLVVHKDNPFLFDFIVDVGQDRLKGEELKKESEKLIRYFLASLAISEKDLWVNLSPYEKDRIIPSALGQTAMGRDLLAQDYLLKQITASLIYPGQSLGKIFWDKVYTKARQVYGTTQIPINTFNKIWIMADKAQVFERNQTAFVVDSHLKVMLEEDYLALTKYRGPTRGSRPNASPFTHSIASQIVRNIILPQLEKEVNTGKNFATLRQITNSLILASWYKNNLKQALLNQLYADKEKIKGINLKDSRIKEQIYERYLQAYKKGVFNFIKEEMTGVQGQTIPRKYFSGGWDPAMAAKPSLVHRWFGYRKEEHGRLVRVGTRFVINHIWPAFVLGLVVAMVLEYKGLRQDQEQVASEIKQIRTSSSGSRDADMKIIGRVKKANMFYIYVQPRHDMTLGELKKRLGFAAGEGVSIAYAKLGDLLGGWEIPLERFVDVTRLSERNVVKVSYPAPEKKSVNPAIKKKAGSTDQAMLYSFNKGGIDLNDSRINWKIYKEGKGVEINIDPAMIKRIKREGIYSLAPEIYSITPVVSIWPLMGMQPPDKTQERLAGI